MKALITDARAIPDKLNKNQDNGNQYLFIPSLPAAICIDLDANQNSLDGIPFRLVIDKPSALVKVIPPFAHAASTRRLAENILLNCLMVGVFFWLILFAITICLTGVQWYRKRYFAGWSDFNGHHTVSILVGSDLISLLADATV